MAGDNLQRMIRLAEEVFAFRTDPDQIVVTDDVREKLTSIHPATLNGEENGDGPIAWMLLIPTTTEIMEEFLAKRITERELLDRTPVGGMYDAIYLCSALVLPEYRNKGIARRLVLDAVRRMQADHPIKALFVWPFTSEGKRLAHALAEELRLPLHERES
jgi:ribosomal protein S18 acetylase RimI-like enzyme